MGSRRRYAAEQEPAPRRAVVQRSEEPGNGVLELQRAAGNKAVAERIEVARDPAAPMDTGTKKGTTIKLGDLGSFEASSFMWGTSNAPGSSGSERDVLHDATVSAKLSELGDLSTKLQQAAARGDRIETVDITIRGTVIHLKDVYISAFQMSKEDDPLVSFTLNFGAIQYGDDEPKGKPDTPSRGA